MATKTKRNRMVLRGCPRCKGDLLRDVSEYVCMQCGRSAPLPRGERLESVWGEARLPVNGKPTTPARTAA
jgi:hypothetical protein